MAHLWTRNDALKDDVKNETEWIRIGVDPAESVGPESSTVTATGIESRPDALYDPNRTRFHQGADGSWAVLSALDTSMRVNGLPVPGICVLRDRDELWLNGRTVFFSTERLARVEPLNVCRTEVPTLWRIQLPEYT